MIHLQKVNTKMKKKVDSPLLLDTSTNYKSVERRLVILMHSFNETQEQVFSNGDAILALVANTVKVNDYNGSLDVVVDVDFDNKTVTKKTISYTDGQITDIS